jgi:hypothetical protein
MKAVLYLLWLIVIVTGGLASGLFLIQRGFGAGHLRFDRALVLLGSPWSFISWPEVVLKCDFVWLVLLPTSMNVLLVLALTILARRH